MPAKKKDPDIVKIWEDTEKTIDRTLLNNEKMLLKSIRKMEKDTISEAAKVFKNVADGIELDALTKVDLKRAVDFHKNLTIEFDQVYGGAVRKTVRGYKGIEKAVVKEFKSLDIPIAFTDFDKGAFKALKSAAIDSFQDLGNDVVTKLSQSMYDSVLTGGSFGDLVENFSTILSAADGTLARYSKQKAHDSLMNFYARMNVKKGVDAGLEEFIWYGNIIGSSRPFCIARAGRTFTANQIQEWDSWKWKGKKPGSTLINRGGYNCRHSLHAVKKEWLDDGKIDVQNWYDEQEGISDKLKAEVKAEETRMKSKFTEVKRKKAPSISKRAKADPVASRFYNRTDAEYYLKQKEEYVRRFKTDEEFRKLFTPVEGYVDVQDNRDMMEGLGFRNTFVSLKSWQDDTWSDRSLKLKITGAKLERGNKLFHRELSKKKLDNLTNFITDEDKREYIRFRALNQAYMKEVKKQKGIELYRGTDGKTGRKITDMVDKDPNMKKVMIKDNFLSGYTSNGKVAKSFGVKARGITVKRKFDNADVFIHEDLFGNITRSCRYEAEYIVMGKDEFVKVADFIEDL